MSIPPSSHIPVILDSFKGKFVAPHATATGDGSVLFVGWRRLPTGMVSGTRYAKVEVFFGSDGNIKNVRIVETVFAN